MGISERGRHWEPEWTEKLKALHVGPMSYSRIATEIGNGLTRNAIIGKVHRLGLERRGQVRGEKRPRHKFKKITGPRPQRANFSLPPIEIEALRCSEVEPLHIALLDLAPGQCRFPYGDGPFTFCGHLKFNGGPYCASHHDIAFQRVNEGSRNTARPWFGAAIARRRAAVLSLMGGDAFE